MITKLCAILCGIALTWTCAATGLFLLHRFNPLGCTGISKARMARLRVQEVEQALSQFEIDNNRCPTGNADLIRCRYVARASLVDPWGTAIAFTCAGDEPNVRSAGPDRIFGTLDDITND